MLSYLCTNIFYKQNSLSSLLEIPILTICAKPALEWRKNAVTVLVAIWVAAIGLWVLQNNFLLHFVSMSVLLLFSFLSTERGRLKRIKLGFGLFFQPPYIWSGCWNSQQFEFGARQSRSLAIILFEQCWEVLSFSSYFFWTARNECLMFFFFRSVVWWSILSFVVMKYMGSLSIPSSKSNALWTYFFSE